MEKQDRQKPTSPRCLKCGEQSKFITNMLDSPTGRTFHMFECLCGTTELGFRRRRPRCVVRREPCGSPSNTHPAYDEPQHGQCFAAPVAHIASISRLRERNCLPFTPPCGLGIPNFPRTKTEHFTSCSATPGRQFRIIPFAWQPWRRIWRVTLQGRPRSADRTGPPAAVSQKREFSKCPPETIGYFGLRMPKIGAWRLVANSQKAAIGGPFGERPGHFIWTPYWLGGAGGFEPPYGEIKNHYLAA
jgi:hypothetical protein